MTVVHKGMDQTKEVACVVIWVDPQWVPHQVTMKARVLSKRRNGNCERYVPQEAI